ncbi:MAG: helix-turn-helix transcriptional regulator [Spirochaetales bacterium]|nr:helix-turn-helix transcriptional regulator [Spirochaetales bacterium]
MKNDKPGSRRKRTDLPPLDIGSRIRRFREARGLTLRALADRCSLSVNAISLIERGKNSPTVSSLHALANALGVAIVEFFQDNEVHDAVYVEKHRRLSHNKDGFLMESLGIGLQNQQLEPFLITLDPGRGGDEPITHPGQEFVHCIKGEVEYHIAENTYKLKQGDSLLLEATRGHYFKNSASKPATFMIVFQAIGNANIGSRLHF